MTLGADIRKARRALGMSQVEFAKKLNVSQSAISNWESDRDRPSINTLLVLTKLTGDRYFLSGEALGFIPEKVLEIERLKLPPLRAKAPNEKAKVWAEGLLDILNRLDALEERVDFLSERL
jgi:transcriptional regulator with XRE-family HTH domain